MLVNFGRSSTHRLLLRRCCVAAISLAHMSSLQERTLALVSLNGKLLSFRLWSITSMSVLLILGRKLCYAGGVACCPLVSHVKLSMRRCTIKGRADCRQTETLRFPLDAASVITWRKKDAFLCPALPCLRVCTFSSVKYEFFSILEQFWPNAVNHIGDSGNGNSDSNASAT